MTTVTDCICQCVRFCLCVCQEADNDPTGTVETKQMLTYYELDLGLNHVVRKYSEGLEDRANFLINGMTS